MVAVLQKYYSCLTFQCTCTVSLCVPFCSETCQMCAMLMLLDYRYGICLTNTKSNKVLIMLTARSELDRKNFIDDLKETILEVRCL